MEALQSALVAFLLITGGLLLALVVYIVILHAARDLASRRRRQLLASYRPLVAATLAGDEQALARLVSSPRRHRGVVSSLLLEPLRVTAGTATVRALAAARALGLVSRWQTQLTDRRSWIRAEAAGALGLVKCPEVVSQLADALDDPCDDVRASAVESLGLLADPQAIPQVIARLGDQSRHQRVRLVHALQQFGPRAVAPLLERGQAQVAERAAVAEILGAIGAAAALDRLLEWSADDKAEVRTAVWQALGTIGVDDRAYYHALRALNDSSGQVRAAAAWALGRSGRQDAAAYLAGRLDDEWIVAAQTARALRALGPAGRRELEEAVATRGSELARQMLWESGVAATV